MKISFYNLVKGIFISLYEKVMIPILRENLQLQKIQALLLGKLLTSSFLQTRGEVPPYCTKYLTVTISFIFSPLGWGVILFLQLLVLLVGWVISRVLKISGIKIEIYYLNKFARLTMIGGLIIWLGLLFWAIKTSWQPSLIMISGLALFTAIISCSKLKSAGKV